MSALWSIESNAQSSSGNNNFAPGKFLGYTQTADPS